MERAEVERLVVELVENQLEGGSVFLEQSFEAQGGDELDAIEIVMELEERLNIGLPDWSHIDLAEVTPGFLVDEVVRVLGEKAAASNPTPEAPPASVAPDVTPAVCQGTNCGALPGGEHSPECVVEAAEAQGWGDAPEAFQAMLSVLNKAACAMRAFTDPEGNMPADTGEFREMKSALAAVEAVLSGAGFVADRQCCGKCSGEAELETVAGGDA